MDSSLLRKIQLIVAVHDTESSEYVLENIF